MSKNWVVTVDIGASKARIQALSRNREYGEVFTFDLFGGYDNDIFLRAISGYIKKIIEALGKKNILAISVGSPGPVDPFSGIIEDTPNLKAVKDFNISEKLEDIFNLPVFLLNDADAAGLGEYEFGAGRGCSSAVYITLSSGVGSAYIYKGELVRGLGKAPEWGHVGLGTASQRQCSCGSWNCAEAYLGTAGLAYTYATVFNLKFSGISVQDRYSISPKMREGIKNKDEKWLNVEGIYVNHLSHLLRSIILVHQPEVIVLGGGIAFGNTSLLNRIRSVLGDRMSPANDKMGILGKDVRINLAAFENCVNLGLAKYAFGKLK